jgi:mannosyltransferase
MRSKTAALACVVALTLLGFALRLHNLAAVPLRGDEAFTVQYWARYDLSRSLTEIATIEPHPILTYVTFHVWGLLAGTTEFSMRLLPALVNLLGVPALYALGKRLGGWRLGLVAALLWAVHPYEIWWGQDARNYGIWAGLSAVALWLGYRAIKQNQRVDWLIYSLSATIAANIYYDELFTTAAFAAFVFLTQWRSRILIHRAIWAFSLPLFTAVLSFLILQGSLLIGGGYGGTASNFDISRLPYFLTTLTFGTTLSSDFVAAIWPIILLTLIVSLWLLWRSHPRQALFLGLTAFLPLLLLSLISLKFKIFAPHYVLSSVPSYILLLAALVWLLPSLMLSTRWRSLPKAWGVRIILLFPILFVTAYTLHNYYDDPAPAYRKYADWPAATRYLAEYVSPDDLVIQLSIDPAFGYYYDAPALDIALPDSPNQPPEKVIDKLEEFTINRNAIWLVGQPYPDWPNRDVVETWMRDHWQSVLDTRVSNLHIQQFRPWQVSADEIETTPLATFENVADLVGSQIFLPSQPSGELTLWLYWQAVSSSSAPLKIFVHLEGAVNPTIGSPLWTQDDQFPQDGRISTADWQPGTIYRDIYTLLFASLLPGTYSLRVGLYDPTTNQRLSTADGDSYLLTTITLP